MDKKAIFTIGKIIGVIVPLFLSSCAVVDNVKNINLVEIFNKYSKTNSYTPPEDESHPVNIKIDVKKNNPYFSDFFTFYDPKNNIQIKHVPKFNKDNLIKFSIKSTDPLSYRKIILDHIEKGVIVTNDNGKKLPFSISKKISLYFADGAYLNVYLENDTPSEFINVYFKKNYFYIDTSFLMSVPNPKKLDKNKDYL